ncbi:MAG: M15 family metallopeptidase [Planctomycetes bacterium]|nr:M15 family metallopeptidase [Planctomycetota bacterium]
MPKFSTRSLANLQTCHRNLQTVFHRVIRTFNCTVIAGYRNQETQDALYAAGKSQLMYPNSLHNSQPARACDVCPYPIDWVDIERFYYFTGYVMATAYELGIALRSGADWDNDTKVNDQKFFDLVHYELI